MFLTEAHHRGQRCSDIREACIVKSLEGPQHTAAQRKIVHEASTTQQPHQQTSQSISNTRELPDSATDYPKYLNAVIPLSKGEKPPSHACLQGIK